MSRIKVFNTPNVKQQNFLNHWEWDLVTHPKFPIPNLSFTHVEQPEHFNQEKKVTFLKEMKELKITHPSLFKGTEISLENFDNLIAEWSKKQPWVEINREIKKRQKIENSEDAGL